MKLRKFVNWTATDELTEDGISRIRMPVLVNRHHVGEGELPAEGCYYGVARRRFANDVSSDITAGASSQRRAGGRIR